MTSIVLLWPALCWSSGTQSQTRQCSCCRAHCFIGFFVFLLDTPLAHVWMLSHFSHVQLFVTPWTIAHQAPLWDSPGKNTGVGCHFLLQGIFLTKGPGSLASPALAGGFFSTSATCGAPRHWHSALQVPGQRLHKCPMSSGLLAVTVLNTQLTHSSHPSCWPSHLPSIWEASPGWDLSLFTAAKGPRIRPVRQQEQGNYLLNPTNVEAGGLTEPAGWISSSEMEEMRF